MTLAETTGPLLRAALMLGHLVPLVARPVLARRLQRGKEDPCRWQEKLGLATVPRPKGRLIWLHAVGLGEVMALRGLIAAMAAPGVSFLVTSGTRASAEVFGRNLPSATQHQFLPLDAPRYIDRFLDHWRPDLSVWAEQELWPTAVVRTAQRGVPLALVNARMNAAAYRRRARAKGLFRDLYSRFHLIAAQDAATAAHLSAFGAKGVRVTGSLKSAAPPLAVDAAELARLQSTLQSRRVWVAASTHVEDEAVAFAAQRALWRDDPRWLLILAPRLPDRRAQILSSIDLPVTLRSRGEGPDGAVWLADTVGELGLWYRLAPVALMGGTFGPVEGHNPWEPAACGAAILHGPNVANFAADYAALSAAGAARQVTPDTLAEALIADHADAGAKARALSQAARDNLRPLAADLMALVGG